jgi:hypothetical protein
MCEETGFAWPTSLAARDLDADAEDEALAAAARKYYRSDGFATIEPDDGMRSALRSGERLLAMRKTASIDHRPRSGSSPRSGGLAITSERLVMIDRLAETLASFDELDDVTLATDRILVVLTTGTGFAIQSCHPRLLRVQLAEARASRIDRQAGASSNTAAALPADLPRR